MSNAREKADTLTLNQFQLATFLEKVAPYRPVFIWGQPGIGKTAVVQQYASKIGLECVTLLGSQLAPEDIIGIPQIMDGTYRYCPPRMIAKHEAYCLFLDEFNACNLDVQKVFYTLIHDRRIGEYILPEGSIVIAAGNRAGDHAIVNHLSSALINRMVHVYVESSTQDWINWARQSYLHPLIVEYIEKNPAHLTKEPTDDQSPFSTPRGWHILSDSLREIDENNSGVLYKALCFGSVSEGHAAQFLEFAGERFANYSLKGLLYHMNPWPRSETQKYDLEFMAHSLFEYLKKKLPKSELEVGERDQELVEKGREAVLSLMKVNPLIAKKHLETFRQNQVLPWFISRVQRELDGGMPEKKWSLLG